MFILILVLMMIIATITNITTIQFNTDAYLDSWNVREYQDN